MRKPASLAISVLLATLLAALLMPMSAFADDDNEEDDSGSVSTPEQISIIEKQETEEKHKQINELYSNPVRISLPPIILRPTSANSDFIAVSPKFNPLSTNSNPTTTRETPRESKIDPLQGAIIDIRHFNSGGKSPAESFIEAAYVGLGAMALGAIALAIAAGTRSIRRK